MADARAIAEAFFDAWTTNDFDAAKQLAHDDLSFTGPIDTFADMDSYLQSVARLSQIVTGVDKRKVFADGDDVCVIYDLHTQPVPDSRVAEWYTVRNGKIASIQVVFDARPFAAMFSSEHR